MVQVRMRVGMTGSRDGENWPPVGHILDCSEDEAQALFQSGIAGPLGTDEEPVDGPTVDEATGRPVDPNAPAEEATPPESDTGGDDEDKAPDEAPAAPVKAESEPEPPRGKTSRRGGPASEPGGN